MRFTDSRIAAAVALTLGVAGGWMHGTAGASSVPGPQQLVDAMRQRYEALNDYHCQIIYTEYRNGRSNVEVDSYYFKKPQLIRLEVTEGKDKGAIVVLRRDGKVRATSGGLLGFFKITMEPDDKRLRDEDGSTFAESHFGGVLASIQSILAGASATATETDGVYRLQADHENVRELVLIDSRTMFPVEWLRLRAGNPQSKTQWKGLQVDVGLKESLFEL
ncbi:MAG: hypothetical protein HYX75_13500 [Acidobacteria bacterium]|nr:hypothetical protein [Acidobacteriota bacterium]